MIGNPMERFIYRLALQMGMTVATLRASLSHDELIGWLAFQRLEPWGCVIEDDRFGVLVAKMVNLIRGLSGDRRTSGPSDFFPPRSELERQAETASKMFAYLQNQGA